jgi:hypothetical protein
MFTPYVENYLVVHITLLASGEGALQAAQVTKPSHFACRHLGLIDDFSPEGVRPVARSHFYRRFSNKVAASHPESLVVKPERWAKCDLQTAKPWPLLDQATRSHVWPLRCFLDF